MRGHIRRRGRKWVVVLEFPRDPGTGRRRQRWLSGFGTRREADRALAQALSELDRGAFTTPVKVTVAAYLRQWLEEYARANVRETTYLSYRIMVEKHLIPALGQIALSQLSTSHLQRYYRQALDSGRKDGHGTKLSERSVLYQHRVLSEALSHAVQWGLVPKNVAQAATPPRIRRQDPKTWTIEELTRFLESIHDAEFYVFALTVLYTGMRRSEALGLRWGDVDLDMASLGVARSLQALPGGRMEFLEPKTEHSRRPVALSPAAVVALRTHKERQEETRRFLRARGTGPWPMYGPEAQVFSRLDGSPLRPSTMSHKWAKLVKKAGVTRIPLHSSRHTHATLMLRAGIHPKIVQERLGHASIATTLNIYSHVAPDIQRAAALRFEEGVQAGDEARVEDKIRP